MKRVRCAAGSLPTLIIVAYLFFCRFNLCRNYMSAAESATTWTSKSTLLQRGNAEKYTIWQSERQLSFKEVIDGWKNSPAFREFYAKLLSDSTFIAAFWESPPVTQALVNQSYEFVLVNSTRLAHVKADEVSFRSHFDKSDFRLVVAFHNLRGDSRLIAPTPASSTADYAHLLSFIRSAPSEQHHRFFECVATEFEGYISGRPMWLSTSGLGVFWLHARIDPLPKYYTFSPYRNAGYLL